jgi:hypothetical protein
MAKKDYKKTKAALKKEEEAVFAAFGIGEGDVSLRRFIRGQRAINGRLYEAIELILDSLPREHSKTSTLDFKKLAEAKKINGGVPGPPPGCGGGTG